MIVDTSAMVATLMSEDGHEELLKTLTEQPGLIPAPVIVEFRRVASRGKRVSDELADAFIMDLLDRRMDVLDYTAEHARVASAANRVYGAGVAPGGSLNLLDLMVYACARVERLPILCTGRDFAATDALIHAASRRD